MVARVPIRFLQVGRRLVPVIEFHAKVGSARLREKALLDTGSAFTIVSERLLQLMRFPLDKARPFQGGIHGVGGATEAWYLEDAVLVLIDEENRLHPVNLKRLFFTKTEMPPIFGREAMTLFNSVLHLDFSALSGHLDIG